MELETYRLRLRQWCDDDLAAFAALNCDPEVMRFFPKVLSQQESADMAARIRLHLDEKGWGLWALEVKGVSPFIGYVGLAVPRFDAFFTPCVEIGWRLARSFWGQGFGPSRTNPRLEFGANPQILDIIGETAKKLTKHHRFPR